MTEHFTKIINAYLLHMGLKEIKFIKFHMLTNGGNTMVFMCENQDRVKLNIGVTNKSYSNAISKACLPKCLEIKYDNISYLVYEEMSL